MSEPTPRSNATDLDFHFGGFHNLMPNRIESVLLVCSLYESFILEEEGLVHELVAAETMDQNLSRPPRIQRVSTPGEAMERIAQKRVDLVIAMTRLGGLGVDEFARRVKRVQGNLPVAALLDSPYDLARHAGLRERSFVDRPFLWNGDAQILLAIHKLFEDQLNVEHDTRVGDVRVIILVENSVRFYSFYLPIIYAELMKLTQSLMREGINRKQRLLRMQARPKVLLATTYEEALDLYRRYSANLLGVISDIRFPRAGNLDPQAGLDLARRVKSDSQDVPVLLQSSDASYSKAAHDLGAWFVHKRSERLEQELRSFMTGHMGFGAFVFTAPDGQEVGRAEDLRQFQEALATVPLESVEYHALHNHFSNWLMARSEFEMAARIRPKRIDDFGSVQRVRDYLIETLAEFRQRTHGALIADFTPSSFDDATTFARIGRGSLGGKGRGLAFIHALLERNGLRRKYENVVITVPRSAVIGTEMYDRFLDENHLRDLGEDAEDAEVARVFRAARLPMSILPELTALLKAATYPLAVRSSSLLEDSLDRPFAGIYSTFMIPNNHPSLETRLGQLCDAIKFVYASAFSRGARRYLEATGHHAGEERMGVILQELVGSGQGDCFYPTFSGVARSFNFYPTSNMRPEEGVAHVALGLGRQVVSGRECLVFSPAHPQVLPQFATTAEWLEHSQRDFYALDLSRPDAPLSTDESVNLVQFDLERAERDGALDSLGSVYSAENDALYDGIQRPGPRLVTFAHVLKSNVFPLAEILNELLAIGREGMGCPIEIEFAVDMTQRPMRFGFLQIRPIISDEEQADVEVRDAERDLERALCFSRRSLGNGRRSDLYDVVYVRPETFDSAHTQEIAAEVGAINESLRKEGRTCVLIGPGRWGTSDPWLGIPVAWEQISQARVLVETTLDGFLITLSQGAHFFQNLTSLGIGYLAVEPAADQGTIDWNWLRSQPALEDGPFVRHVRLSRPLGVRLDGRSRRGVVFKPDASEAGERD